MKTQKRLLTWILVAVLAVAAVALVACVDKPQKVELNNLSLPDMDNDQMVLIIKNRNDTYTAHVVTLGRRGTDAATVEDVISYLVEQGQLTVDWTDGGETGKWLNDIGGLEPDSAAHEYVALYTSVESDWSAGAGELGYKIDGVTVAYSGFGVSGMHVQAGAVIYFELQTW